MEDATDTDGSSPMENFGKETYVPNESSAAVAIYNASYAPVYERLFIEHPLWEPKRAFNKRAISALLHPLGLWLDTCCGQGWHLAQFPNHRRVGLDISGAQLKRAQQQNPGVSFIQADLSDYEFPDEQWFDLVTNFWSAYSYLNDEAKIRAMVEKMVRWTAPGGALYMELTAPEMLEDFNASEFAAETETKVVLQSPDGVRWQFHDPGGVHQMMSPPLEFFTNLIAPHFTKVESGVVIRSLRQLIALGRI